MAGAFPATARASSLLLGTLAALVLAVALGWPWLQARSIAAVEAEAEAIVRALVAELATEPMADLTMPATTERLLAAASRIAPGVASVPLPDGAKPPAFACTSPAYCFLVLRTPAPEELGLEPGPAPASFEVYGWPRTALQSGQSAFFAPTDGALVFSRNLQGRYTGWQRVPRPGDGRPRDPARRSELEAYRGRDDERWLQTPADR